MNESDLLWLVGLCEGEATFDAQRGRYPRIRIGMTDRDVVGRAASLMGCSVRLSLKPAPMSAMWHAEIQGARAAELMRLMLPHMGARRSARIADVLGHTSLTSGQKPGPRITRPPGLAHLMRETSRTSIEENVA